MASKATIVNGEERPSPVKRQGENPVSKFSGGVLGQWNEFTRFLSDVRAEMRKVVTPSRKEVESTTTVVIIAVFLFGVFFLVCDTIFQNGLHALLGRLGGF
ncbi:MAG: preprotein translocase subunit SecE [Terracidiphilus sp.]|jgi:preprotein translocase subunit SecE